MVAAHPRPPKSSDGPDQQETRCRADQKVDEELHPVKPGAASESKIVQYPSKPTVDPAQQGVQRAGSFHFLEFAAGEDLFQFCARNCRIGPTIFI